MQPVTLSCQKKKKNSWRHNNSFRLQSSWTYFSCLPLWTYMVFNSPISLVTSGRHSKVHAAYCRVRYSHTKRDTTDIDQPFGSDKIITRVHKSIQNTTVKGITPCPLWNMQKHSHKVKALPEDLGLSFCLPFFRPRSDNFLWKTDNFSQNIWFSQQCCWRCRTSKMLYRVES